MFAEATLGSAKAGKTSYEDLSGSAQLLTDSERQYTYYDLALGWNALPGEVVPRRPSRHAERRLLHARRRQHATSAATITSR